MESKWIDGVKIDLKRHDSRLNRGVLSWIYRLGCIQSAGWFARKAGSIRRHAGWPGANRRCCRRASDGGSRSRRIADRCGAIGTVVSATATADVQHHKTACAAPSQAAERGSKTLNFHLFISLQLLWSEYVWRTKVRHPASAGRRIIGSHVF